MEKSINELKKEFKVEVKDYFSKLNKEITDIKLGNGVGGSCGGYYKVYKLSWMYENQYYEIGIDQNLRCGCNSRLTNIFNDKAELYILCNKFKDFYKKII